MTDTTTDTDPQETALDWCDAGGDGYCDNEPEYIVGGVAPVCEEHLDKFLAARDDNPTVEPLGQTSVRLDKSTRDRLRRRKRGGESYDDVLRRLLDATAD